ncbi:hypothetical protein VTJ49DRAFT_6247 [Mycothermus thermophilus]|uniref:Uncharacterized protein n=1 Tax=Humicola insolens TaxID=85995 RepID=A0ABR3V1L8_HUMIN
MDTISNLAQTASKVIWGETEQHEEPVSGKMGDVAAGEPYDAGNIGEPNEAALAAGEKMEAKQHSVETPAGEPSTTDTAATERFTDASAPQAMTKPDTEPETASKLPSGAGKEEEGPLGPIELRDDEEKLEATSEPATDTKSFLPLTTSTRGDDTDSTKAQRGSSPAPELASPSPSSDEHSKAHQPEATATTTAAPAAIKTDTKTTVGTTSPESIPGVPQPPTHTTTTSTKHSNPTSPPPYHTPSPSSSASSIPHTPPAPSALAHARGHKDHHREKHQLEVDKLKALKLAESIEKKRREEERMRQERQRFLSMDENDDTAGGGGGARAEADCRGGEGVWGGCG